MIVKLFEDFSEFNNKEGKIIYDFDKVTKLINYFNSEYEDYPNKQGWGIFDSDTEIPNEKYWSNRMWMGKRVGGYYQVQKLDSPGPGEALIGDIQTDSQAWELSRKTGLMVDEYGVIYGWKGKSILEKNIYNMKHLKTFENYTDGDPSEEPINLTEVYGINKSDLEGVLSYLTDEHKYLDFEITGDYKSFNIEIFDVEFSKDTTQDLKNEYREFQKKVLPSLKKWLFESNLKIEKEGLDDDRNRIIIKISKSSIKESK